MNKIFAVLLSLTCLPVLANDIDTDDFDYDVSDIDVPQYTDGTGIAWDKFSSGYYDLDGGTKNHAAGLNSGDWRIFYKTQNAILGTSTCNQYSEVGMFSAGEQYGRHCWCKIIAATKDIKKSIPTKWAYRGEFQDVYECSGLCTYRCAHNFLGDIDFRIDILNNRDF